jgi:hypothetical protein
VAGRGPPRRVDQLVAHGPAKASACKESGGIRSVVHAGHNSRRMRPAMVWLISQRSP